MNLQMHISKRLLIFLLLNSIFSAIIAQNRPPKTPYELKLIELTQKYVSIFVYGSEGKLSSHEKAQVAIWAIDEKEREAAINTYFLKYYNSHNVDQSRKIALHMTEEFKNAKKLISEEDNRKEKEKQALILKKERYEKFKETTEFRVLEKVYKSLEEWKIKGELEKTSDFELRIKNVSKDAFYYYCFLTINSELESIIQRKNHRGIAFHNILFREYNADEEYFKVAFYGENSNFTDKLYCPSNQASQVIEEISSSRSTTKTFIEDPSTLNPENWVFYMNEFFPGKITLTNTKTKQIQYFHPPSEDTKKLVIFGSDIYFDSTNIMHTMVFNYNEYYEKLRKKDSLIYRYYDIKVDSLKSYYANAFLNNPFNHDKQDITSIVSLKGMKLNQMEVLQGSNVKLLNINLNNEYESDFNQIAISLSQLYKKSVKEKIYEYIKINGNENFINKYLSLNNELKDTIDKWYDECWCRKENIKKAEFYLDPISAHLDNLKIKKPECGCKVIAYSNYRELFANLADFDTCYSKGQGLFIPEIQKRSDLKYLKNNENIIKDITLFEAKTSRVSGTPFKLYNFLISRINEPYYQDLLRELLELNSIFKLEWETNGKYFDNISSFFEAYVSDGYKKKIKSLKK